MLSQEELDKLLAEGVDQEGEQEEKAAAEGQPEPQPQEGAPQAEAGEGGEAGGGEAPQEAAPSGGDDLDWEAAFKEAAAGGDPAAAKQLQEGTVNPEAEQESGPPPEIEAAESRFSDFGREKEGGGEGGAKPDLDFILDIPLQVSVELGRAKLQIRDLLQLGRGSVIELNKMAGEPAEIYVNNKLMAKGEIVVVNEKFGVRLTEIISPADRVRSLG